MLKVASESLDSLLAAGLLRSDAEKANASTQSAFARSRDAAIEASDASMKRYPKQSPRPISTVTPIIEARSPPISEPPSSTNQRGSRQKPRHLEHKSYDYGMYSPYHSGSGAFEEIALYSAATDDSIREGLAKLKIAARDYTQLLLWGAKQRASEAKALALGAKRAADVSKADTSASDTYASATASVHRSREAQRSR